MRTLHTLLFIAVIALAVATGARAAEPAFNPGLWETTITMEMKGGPKGVHAMPPKTERHCIKTKSIDHVPKPGMDKSCKVDQKQKGANTMTWTMQCENQGRVSKGYGESTTDGDSGHGFFEMTMDGGPSGPMVMRTNFKSKRVGECS